MNLDHSEGFEKEERFKMVFSQARCDCPALMTKTVKRIIAHFALEFIAGLFNVRPCVRRLKYIGCFWDEDDQAFGETPDEFFKIGEIYESIDFNGGTYTIKDRPDRRIGRAYFERIT